MWFKWVGIGFDIKLEHLNHIIFPIILSYNIMLQKWSCTIFPNHWNQAFGNNKFGSLKKHGQNLYRKALVNMGIEKLNILHIGTNSQQPVDTHVMQIADSRKCVWFKCEVKSHMRVKIFQRPILRISMIWKWCYYGYDP